MNLVVRAQIFYMTIHFCSGKAVVWAQFFYMKIFVLLLGSLGFERILDSRISVLLLLLVPESRNGLPTAPRGFFQHCYLFRHLLPKFKSWLFTHGGQVGFVVGFGGGHKFESTDPMINFWNCSKSRRRGYPSQLRYIVNNVILRLKCV